MTSLPSKPDPDPGLIKRAQRGDRDALKVLLEQVSPVIQQWAMARTGDSDAASDLCQEVLVVLLKRISSYRGEARFLTWLFSVTRNQALEGVRRNGRYEEKMTRFRAEQTSPAVMANREWHPVDRGRLRTLVETFVRELPDRQREVFQLCELQGLSSPEAGGVLNLAPGSVRAALLKARRTLRKKILEGHPEFVEEYLP